jgi:hypothetical protein
MLISHAQGQFAASLVTGLTGGVLSGMFGIGGGIILLPLLRLILGLGQHQAQGLTLAAMLLPAGIPALVHYHRRGIKVPWGVTLLLALGFLPGVWAGARFAGVIPEGPLRWSFVGFLLLLAAWTAFLPENPGAPRCLVAPPVPAPHWKACLVGVAGGLCSGLLGIGGGVVMIPLLALWLRLPQHQAQLVSLIVMVAPIRLPGVMVYAHEMGRIHWSIPLGLATGVALGTHFGARLAMSLSGPRLRSAFAGLMLLTAGMMIWKG